MSRWIEMNGELPFRIFYAVVYVSALSIRIYHSRKFSPVVEKNYLKRWIKVAETEGRFSAVLWTILAVFWVSFALFYAVLHVEFVKVFAAPLPLWLRWIGIGLGITAIPFLFWIHQTIAESWIAYLDLRENHCLVTDGPYRWIRHPMYSQTIMFLASLSLISANLLMMLASAIVVILILNRIPREERMMIERFGAKYQEYMNRTGRLLPRLKK